jgi:hypothetical protein
LAVIGGAKSWSDVKKTVRGGFFPVIRVNFLTAFVLAGINYVVTYAGYVD